MKGFKATNLDLTCRDYQFELGKHHLFDGVIFPCKTGFHFCDTLSETLRHYPFCSRLFEVESGDITFEHMITSSSKVFVTNEIKFVIEVDYMELLNECDARLFSCGLYNVLRTCNNDPEILRKVNRMISGITNIDIENCALEAGYIYSKRVGLVHHSKVSDDKIVKMFKKQNISKLIKLGVRTDLFIKDKKFHVELAKHGFYLDKLKHSNNPDVLAQVAKRGITDINIVEDGKHKFLTHKMDRILYHLVRNTNKYNHLVSTSHKLTIDYLFESNRIEEFFNKKQIVELVESESHNHAINRCKNKQHIHLYTDLLKDKYDFICKCDDIDLLKQIAEKTESISVCQILTRYGILCKNDYRVKDEIDYDFNKYSELRFLPFSIFNEISNPMYNLKERVYNFLMKQKDIKCK